MGLHGAGLGQRASFGVIAGRLPLGLLRFAQLLEHFSLGGGIKQRLLGALKQGLKRQQVRCEPGGFLADRRGETRAFGEQPGVERADLIGANGAGCIASLRVGGGQLTREPRGASLELSEAALAALFGVGPLSEDGFEFEDESRHASVDVHAVSVRAVMFRSPDRIHPGGMESTEQCKEINLIDAFSVYSMSRW